MICRHIRGFLHLTCHNPRCGLYFLWCPDCGGAPHWCPECKNDTRRRRAEARERRKLQRQRIEAITDPGDCRQDLLETWRLYYKTNHLSINERRRDQYAERKKMPCEPDSVS